MELINLAVFLFHFTLGTTVTPTGPRQVESEFATMLTVVSLRRLLVDPPDEVVPQPEMEFKEFEPRFKSAKTRFKLSAGLNLETFDTIFSGTNHIYAAA